MIDLNNISEKTLQDLVDNKVFEKKTLEYKQSITIDKDADRKEFLADISSFANKEGGVVIFGISEDKMTGEPNGIDGLSINNIDEEQLRINNIIRDGISPRISAEVIPVKLSKNNSFCLVISIQKSWNFPHRVTFKGHDKFYTRNSNGKYPMDIDELRDAFIMSNSLTEKIENFRRHRLSKIATNQTPVPITSNSKVILHFIPAVSFNTGYKIDLQYVANNYNDFKPPLGGSWDGQYNLNGYMTYSHGESYSLIFNSGIIEAVNTSVTQHKVNETIGIPSAYFERMFFDCAKSYLKVQHGLGIAFPIFVFVTFLGVKNIKLFTEQVLWGPSIPNMEDTLDLTETRIESYDLDNIDKQLKGTIDSLYNAYGHKGSFSYNAQGRWSPR